MTMTDLQHIDIDVEATYLSEDHAIEVAASIPTGAKAVVTLPLDSGEEVDAFLTALPEVWTEALDRITEQATAMLAEAGE